MVPLELDMSMDDVSQGEQRRIEVPVRVRYVECDPMNVAHHSVYPVWLEIARTDLLRRRGNAYRDLEVAGDVCGGPDGPAVPQAGQVRRRA